MTGPQARSLSAAVLMACSLMLLAMNLRPLFSSLSILLPEVSHALGMSGAMAGYLTTLPVLCMGLFAPLAPRLGRHIGTERTLLLALILLTLGLLLRGTGDLAILFLGTALAGSGIALGNVLLPSIVKRDFPANAPLMTGLYTMSLVGGAALAAAATLPLMHAMDDDWVWGLGIWTIPALLALLAWAPYAWQGGAHAAQRRILPVAGLRGDPLAWAVTLFMGLQSSMAYCVLGWLAPILRARGMDGTEAGIVVSLSVLSQAIACLLTPLLTSRSRDQRALCSLLTLLTVMALFGLLFGPLWSSWPWAVLLGIGQGGLFTVAMTLIVLRSPDAHVAAHLSSMAQTLGYMLAATGPLMIGILHEQTGQFETSGWLFAALGLATLAAGWIAGRDQLVRARTLKA